MVRIDENQEAIAQIRMAIDNDTRSRAPNDIGEDPELVSKCDSREQSGVHWRLGSQYVVRLNTAELEWKFSSNYNFHDFDGRLRSFISENLPSAAIRYEDVIHVSISRLVNSIYNTMY